MPDTEAKLKFLQSPESYGNVHQHVQCVETHMSWVFLVGQHVFKLKKPVCFPFLDFTTLQAREFYCREEVRLNSRMAPDIYLGVIALQWQGGAFALVPEDQLPARGETVDWLVLMKRLPSHRTLDQLIAARHVAPRDMGPLVEVLARFYRSAPVASLSAEDYLARFQYEQAANREVLLRPQFQLRHAGRAIDYLGVALARGENLLRARVAAHRVLEGHGDLRPEHVCLLQPPVVIDCLEFNLALRQVDPFDEVAYLGLECDMAGAPWMGPHVASGLAIALDDHPAAALMHLYTAYRAVLRARLAMAHLLDPKPRVPHKWLPLAERYLLRAIDATDAFMSIAPHEKP